MEKLNKIFKSNLMTTIAVSVVVSAVVGGTFGFYGASFFSPGQGGGNVFNRTTIVSPETKFVSNEEAKVIEVVKKSAPSVVSIVATKDLTIIERGFVNPFQDFCDDPFFRQFLGSQCDQQSRPPRQRTEKRQVSAGTGFVVSNDGLILTNKHVISITDADFTVITNDDKRFPAKVLARDPVKDLAILKIDNTVLPILPLGNSDKLQSGQTVIAIGNSLGQFSNTVSKGVISGLSRSIVAGDGSGFSERLDQVIQTDAAINPGNSGGPLLNLSGEVIGVNTAIVQGAQNVGFAIPINQAKRDINQVKKSGKISYPFIGIRYVAISEEIKKQNNLPVDFGVLIIGGNEADETAIVPNSPAAKAGLKAGDIILEIDGKKITVENDLAKQLQNYNVGDSVSLKVLSQGREKLIKVTLTERE